MRIALPLGLLLLVLTLLLNVQAGAYDRLIDHGTSTEASLQSGTTVRIFSTGTGFVPDMFGRNPLHQAIVVDGDFMKHATSENGLRVATFFVEGEDSRFENFNLSESDETVAEFAELVDSAPVHAVIAISLFRTIAPTTSVPQEREEQIAKVAEVLATLGARATPHMEPRASWAFLAIRMPHGWVPLSESYSRTKGVSVAFSLVPEVERYAGYRGEYLEDHRQVLPLVRHYKPGETRIDPATSVRKGYASTFEVGFVRRNGIMASPYWGAEARKRGTSENSIVWTYFLIGPDARFETQLGLEHYFRRISGGVEFQVLVDGELAGSRVVSLESGDPDAWLPWSVDLSRWEGKWVAFELRTRRLDAEPGVPPPQVLFAYWGEPTLVLSSRPFAEEGLHGLSRHHEMLARLDQNKDGYLTRDECLRGLEALDRNGNGLIEPGEPPRKLEWVIDRLDTNGDGAVDGSETDVWIDALNDR